MLNKDDSGWIKLYRIICNNWIWSITPFSPGQAWVDLMLQAKHCDSKIYVRGIEVKLKRGQAGISIRTLTRRWGWSRTKINNFLKRLEKEHQIKPQKNNVTTIISIINYELYQQKEPQNKPQKSHNEATEVSKGTSDNVCVDPKNDKNNKKEYSWENEKYFNDEELELTFRDFLQIREKIKAVNSERAIKSLIKTLNNLTDNKNEAIRIIEQSIRNSWKDLYPLKNKQ